MAGIGENFASALIGPAHPGKRLFTETESKNNVHVTIQQMLYFEGSPSAD